jgi:hypothetical protein
MIFKVHFATTWALIGAVWFVQVVYYPALRLFSKDEFKELERFHIRRTSALVLPVMLLEGITAIILAFQGPLLIFNAFLLALIWGMTFGGCFPTHVKLKEGYSERLYQRLTDIHAARVGLWTLRGIILFFV